jgi:hypothetical protein
MQFDIGILFVVICFSTCSPNICYRIQYKKIKIVKLVKFHVISGVVSYKSSHIYEIVRGINTFFNKQINN